MDPSFCCLPVLLFTGPVRNWICAELIVHLVICPMKSSKRVRWGISGIPSTRFGNLPPKADLFRALSANASSLQFQGWQLICRESAAFDVFSVQMLMDDYHFI